MRVICEAVRHLDDAAAEWVQDQVLQAAPHQSVAQLRAALARVVIAADPEGANARHRRARKDRRVGVGPEQDGMATVWAALAAHDAQQVFGTLTGLARSLGAEDPRGMDARRADLLVGLMTGEISIAFPAPDGPGPGSEDPGSEDPGSEDPGSEDPGSEDPGGEDPGGEDPGSEDPGGGTEETGGEETSGDEVRGKVGDEVGMAATAHSAAIEACPVCAAQAWRASRPRLRPVNPTKPLVQILIGHSTLRGADHAPAELVGYGAIGAEQAREIAADAVWRRLIFDAESGALLDHGRRTYRPPAALADHVRARDVVCRSPLCRRRALDCELDHTVPFPHGPTAEPNLATGCLLHHGEKHAPGWTVLQHPDGRIDWTTPTGHVYSSEVHDYRPLSPPPPPSIPGPIADHTDTQPPPPGPRARTRHVDRDWTGTDHRDDDPHDLPPF